MRTFFQGITHFYRNLRLQTKLTITHLVIVTIPMVAIPVLFFTQLYDMIVADTVRKEQEAAIQTAPMIEETVADILAFLTSVPLTMPFLRKLRNDAQEAESAAGGTTCL